MYIIWRKVFPFWWKKVCFISCKYCGGTSLILAVHGNCIVAEIHERVEISFVFLSVFLNMGCLNFFDGAVLIWNLTVAFIIYLYLFTSLDVEVWNCFLQVSVAPGGRWSRFKTYSTIQRTLEIWGFVITFIFRVWLNNQKFSYKGRSVTKAYFGALGMSSIGPH